MGSFNQKPKGDKEYDRSEHASGQVNVKMESIKGKAVFTPRGAEVARSGNYSVQKD